MSTEMIQSKRLTSSRITGTTRLASVCASTAVAPGRVDSPSTSTMVAPSSSIVFGSGDGTIKIVITPAIRERIRRNVQYSHNDGGFSEMEAAFMGKLPFSLVITAIFLSSR